MAKIIQSRPKISPRRHSSSLRRLGPIVLICSILGTMTVISLQSISTVMTTITFSRSLPINTINSQSIPNRIRHGGEANTRDNKTNSNPKNDHSQNLPLFPEDPIPPLDESSRKPLNLLKVHEWAKVPLTGSYLHRQNDNSMTRIHMPLVDLQSEAGQIIPALKFSTTPLSIKPRATLGKSFASPDCVVLTRKGNKFSQTGVSSNQDRIGISDYVVTNPKSKDSNGAGSANILEEFWMGLFDGHGELGHVISHFAITEFPRLLETLRHQTSMDSEATKVALKDIFLSINAKMPHILGAGSTGISIWKRKEYMYISNLGDSKAFVVSVNKNQNVKVVYSTKPHKPDDPEERQRIEGMGGQVQEAPAPGFSSRLLIPIGPTEFDMIGLAMSRSLGDFDGQPYGLIAEPTTDAIALSSLDPGLDYLVILGSDGLLDRVSEIEIAQTMSQSQLLTPDGKYTALEAAEVLILKASLLWSNDEYGQGYRDDISLAVHRLRL